MSPRDAKDKTAMTQSDRDLFRQPEAVRRAVIEILAHQALRDPATLSAADKVADLGIDSLGLAEVTFGIEERFDVTVPAGADQGGLDFGTVGAVVAAVQGLVLRPVPAQPASV